MGQNLHILSLLKHPVLQPVGPCEDQFGASVSPAAALALSHRPVLAPHEGCAQRQGEARPELWEAPRRPSGGGLGGGLAGRSLVSVGPFFDVFRFARMVGGGRSLDERYGDYEEERVLSSA